MATATPQLSWWTQTTNHYSHQLDAGINATTARLGSETRIICRAKNVDGPVMEVCSHHLKHATDTPAGHYTAAITAHMAAHPPKRGETMWKPLIIIAFLAGCAALSLGFGGNSPAEFLMATMIALVSTVAAAPLVKWNLSNRSAQFYNAIQWATDTAGVEAAEEAAEGTTSVHRTVLHNLLAGEPLTPKKYQQAILNTVNRHRQIQATV